MATEQRITAACTVTFSSCVENHVGNQQLGERATEGYSYEELCDAEIYMDSLGCETELIALHEALDPPLRDTVEPAWVLVLRDCARVIGCNPDIAYQENMQLPHDRKYLDTRQKRVKNKRARYNLCYTDTAQEPCYEEGKGRVVAWESIPETEKVRDFLEEIIPRAAQLNAELNVYYNPQRCGIGFHGDTERPDVIALRLGVTIPLVYRWYHNCRHIGREVRLELNHGDMYVMSANAVGCDWLKRSRYTLRHAAGCKTYTNPKPKK